MNNKAVKPTGFVKVTCSDFQGEYTTIAQWVPYKLKPHKGRWMYENGDIIRDNVVKWSEDNGKDNNS